MESDQSRPNLSYYPVPVIQPPRFLWTDEDGTPDKERQIEVIRENYNGIVELLDGGNGYEALLAVKQRLENHIETIEEELDKHESQLHFCQSQADGIKSRIRRIAETERDDKEDLDPVIEHVLERPMGEHWGTGGGTTWKLPRTEGRTRGNRPRTMGPIGDGPRTDRGPTGAGPNLKQGPLGADTRMGEWALHEDHSIKYGPAVSQGEDEDGPEGPDFEKVATTRHHSDLRITYTPESGGWNREYEDNHIEPYDQLEFRGDETWGEAIDLAKRRRRLRRKEYEGRQRTARFLRFRLTVVKEVLYRFEAFGSVEPMGEEEARKHAGPEFPNIFDGRPRLREHVWTIVQKYREAPEELPKTMSRLKAWIGREGENAVKLIQDAFRKEGLKDEYTHGDPESFCELVEQLHEASLDS